MSAAKSRNREIKGLVQNDPLHHLEEIQGIRTLEPYQKHILREISKHDRICIKACHDVGKTFLMARVVLWFLSSHYRSKVITTAPTARQVKHLLWSEIQAGFKASRVGLGGECFTQMWKIDPDWMAIGFASKASAGDEGQDNSAFQGWHSEHMLIIFDEATGISPTIWQATEGMLTSGDAKFIAIGNPTSRQSVFYEKFHSPLWHKISLSCFDSPNLSKNGFNSVEDIREALDELKTLSDDEMIAKLKSYKVYKKHLITAKWVLEFAYDWGIDHPLFQGKVLGNFPEEDDSILMPLAVVEAAQLREEDYGEDQVHIGVDVARMGSDKTVIQLIRGNTAEEPVRLVKKDNREVAGYVLQQIRRFPKIRHLVKTITVDSTGVGSGVIDTIREWQREGYISPDIKVREAHFGAAVQQKRGKAHYANYKAKIYCDLAEDLRERLVLPDETCYQEQLPAIRHSVDSKGRIVIESKEGFKKRTGRSSPDEADALALANDGKRSYDQSMDFQNVMIESVEKESTWI
jgi:hypothetical protein